MTTRDVSAPALPRTLAIPRDVAAARAEAGSRAATLALVAILLLAAALRLWGAFHDLPFSYFGDELHFMKRSMAMGTGDLNPHWFHKPALLMYVLAFFYGLYFVVGLVTGRFESTSEFGAHFLFEPGPFILIGRLVVLAFGVATVYVVYRIGCKVFRDHRAGLASALVAAVLGPMIVSAQTIKSDVPCGFLMTLSIYFYLGARENPRLRPLLLAALFAGLAMGTHYYGIVLVPTFLAMEALRGFDRSSPWGTVIKRVALVAVLFVAGFFLSSPYNFIDPLWRQGVTDSLQKTFAPDPEQAEAHFEPDNRVVYEPGPSAWLGASGAFFKLVTSHNVMGIALALLAALGLLHTLARRETRWYGLLVLVPCLFFFLAAITIVAYHAQPRHLNAIYPLLATLAWPGALVLLRPFRLAEGRAGAVALALVALAAIPTLLYSVDWNRQLTRLDSRLVSYRFIHDELPRGARLLVDDYGPFLNPNPVAAQRLKTRLAALSEGPFTHHQGLRIELIERYPPKDGVDMDELGHPWWLAKEKSDAELRSNAFDLDMGSPLVTRQPKELARFRDEDGIRYVITNSEARDQYFKAPRAQSFPSFNRFYRELEKTRRIETFDPKNWDGKGPIVWIYDISQPAPAGQPPITLEGRRVLVQTEG